MLANEKKINPFVLLLQESAVVSFAAFHYFLIRASVRSLRVHSFFVVRIYKIKAWQGHILLLLEAEHQFVELNGQEY